MKESKKLLHELKSSLKNNLTAHTLSPTSKVPFKIATLLESLKHRSYDTGQAPRSLFSQELSTPAIVLARSSLENAASIFSLYKHTNNFLKSKQLISLDEYLMKGLPGQRFDDNKISSLNILTAIEKTDKEFIGFKEQYLYLCEYAHPNWAGVLGSYCTKNEETHTAYFRKRNCNNSMALGLSALCVSLRIANDKS